MNGKDWAKAHKNSDYTVASLANSASANIVGKSRIARKAREFAAARDAFIEQLEKNGVFAD